MVEYPYEVEVDQWTKQLVRNILISDFVIEKSEQLLQRPSMLAESQTAMETSRGWMKVYSIEESSGF